MLSVTEVLLSVTEVLCVSRDSGFYGFFAWRCKFTRNSATEIVFSGPVAATRMGTATREDQCFRVCQPGTAVRWYRVRRTHPGQRPDHSPSLLGPHLLTHLLPKATHCQQCCAGTSACHRLSFIRSPLGEFRAPPYGTDRVTTCFAMGTPGNLDGLPVQGDTAGEMSGRL